MIKNAAKSRLAGHYLWPILFVLLCTWTENSFRLLAEAAFPLHLPLGVAANLLLQLPIYWLSQMLGMGYLLVMLKLAAGQKYNGNDLLSAFSTSPERIRSLPWLALAFALIQSLCLFPSALFTHVRFFPQSPELLWKLQISLLELLGEGVFFLLTLPWSQAPFLALDYPHIHWRQALARSRQMMLGHKKRYLQLAFSLFPLFLLSLSSFMLGFLWLIPYWVMCRTCFYLDLSQNTEK